MRVPRNSWGYDTVKEPFPQLLTLLGISSSSERACALRSRLRALTVSCLDPKHTSSEQPPNLGKLWKKISQEYPQSFSKLDTEDTVERMFLVFRVVARMHDSRLRPTFRQERSRNAKGIAAQKPKKRSKRMGLEEIARRLEAAERMEAVELIDLDLGGSDSEMGDDVDRILVAKGTKDCANPGANAQAVPKAFPTEPPVPRSLPLGSTVKPRASRNLITSYFKSADTSSQDNGHSQNSISSTSAPRTSNKRPSTYEQPLSLNTQPNALPRLPMSVSAPSLPPPPQLRGDLATCNEIRTFLSKCRPPLDHLLPNFLAYGCTSGEYLRSVAALPGTRRREVLRRIIGTRVTHGASNSAGCKVVVKEIDLDMLEDCFDRGFEE